jgi:ABC-type transport system substrate-binding protein
MAESIESEDAQTWTITLREGWTFHNGEPVDAESFVNAWNFGANANNAADNAYFFENIMGYEDVSGEDAGEDDTMSGLRVVDDQTFEVELSDPFSQFPLTVGYNAFYPLPDAFFEGKERQFRNAPIGNGPYQIQGEWEHDQRITVERYEDFAGTPGNADEIEFRVYSDPNTAYTDVQAGELDILDQVPSEVLAGAEQEFGDAFIRRESSYFGFLGFPTYQEPFDNPDVRKAFSMAIDRGAITEAIFQGTYTPAASIINPVVTGYREDACGEACEFNPDRARELLEEAGGFDGKLELWFNSDGGHEEWMEALSNQLRQNLGIEDIEFQALEFAEYLEKLDNEEITGPFRLAWVMDYPSPQNYLQPIFSCTGSTNFFGYCNEEADNLILEGNRAESIDDGIEDYHNAEDLILQDLPAAPMWFGVVSGVHSDNVSNVIIDVFSQVRPAEVEVNQ